MSRYRVYTFLHFYFIAIFTKRCIKSRFMSFEKCKNDNRVTQRISSSPILYVRFMPFDLFPAESNLTKSRETFLAPLRQILCFPKINYLRRIAVCASFTAPRRFQVTDNS